VNRIGLILALVLGLAALLVVSKRKQAEIARGLPPRVVCTSQADALAQAGAGATPILGTGSMAPWIPAALPGLDPRKTVVAYAAMDGAATFAGVTVGALVVYVPAWASGGHVMHQAAARDSGGWIMSGLHNERSETWERVTAANYVGTVARVYVWAQ
jgi:hypothetical protein